MTEYTTVLELLSDPARWGKGVEAVNAKGESVEYDSSTAVKWCLLGGLKKIYGRSYSPGYEKARTKLMNLLWKRDLGYSALTCFNDSIQTDHKLLLDVLKEAGV